LTVEVFSNQALEPSAELARRWGAGGMLQRGGTVGSVIGGLVAASDLQITAAVSGLKVEVAAGEVYVPGSSSATQSGYYVRNSATATLTFGAADGTNPRIETVIARVKDKAYTGTEDLAEIAFVAGTATAGATLSNLNGKGAVPASSYVLGYVLVPAKATSLTNTEVKNTSAVALPGLQRYEEGTAAARPAAGVKGRIYYATDTECHFIDTGSAWQSLFSLGTASKWTALKSYSKAEAEAGVEPSATRAATVVFTSVASLTIGGVAMGGGGAAYVPYPVPPGQKWKLTVATEAQTLLL